MVQYNDKISSSFYQPFVVLNSFIFDKIYYHICIYLYKISIQNINYKTVSYCFAIGPCTNFWLPTTLNAPIYLDAFLLVFNVSAVTIVNVPFFYFFLVSVLIEDAAALGVVDTLALGVGDAATALGAPGTVAGAAALEDAPGTALAASASTTGVNAIVGCTVEPPTLP